MEFRALRVSKNKQSKSGIEARIEQLLVDELTPGEVLIKVAYSGINYKDALAVTGYGKIIRNYPLNAGIDVAGEVVESTDPLFSVGDKVIANGSGFGEELDGGFAEYARLPAELTIPLPEGLSLKEAMIIGTAGFTAVLALHRMEVNGQNPALGPIVVTGASGGVGSFAVDILSKKGYEVIAISGREQFHPLLKSLGANEVVKQEELALSDSPLDAVRFGGAIDNVGGKLLGQLITTTQLWGNVASIGLAASQDLNTAVFPFILRGVSLLGVSSANCPMPLRKALWGRLGDDLKPDHLDLILTEEITMEGILPASFEMLQRKRHGRTIIKL